MRHFIAFFILFVACLNTNGQNKLSKLINEFNVPSDWHSKIDYNTSYFPLFQQKRLASWTLFSSEKKQRVIFFIYKYSVNDSAIFRKKIIDYYILSSCLNYPSTIQEENFMPFAKGQYFFVMKMCPCSTDQNLTCKMLAKKLFLWANLK